MPGPPVCLHKGRPVQRVDSFDNANIQLPNTPLSSVPEDGIVSYPQLPSRCFACLRELGWSYFAPQPQVWQPSAISPFSAQSYWPEHLTQQMARPTFSVPNPAPPPYRPASPPPTVPTIDDYFDYLYGPHTAITADTSADDALQSSPSDASEPQQASEPNPHPDDVERAMPRSTPSRNTEQQRRRRMARAALCNRPLNESNLGRCILALCDYDWFLLGNGIATMRFGEHESAWRANDMANCINWLRCGAYCHRSLAHNAIGIANIASLNALIASCGHTPIAATEGTPDWPFVEGRGSPSFFRSNFISHRPRRHV